MAQQVNRLTQPVDDRQSIEQFFQASNRMSQASPEQRNSSVVTKSANKSRKSIVKLNDDVVIEDAELDQDQFQNFDRRPSSYRRPSEQGVYLSQNTRMPGDIVMQPVNNQSKVTDDEDLYIGDTAEGGSRKSVPESPGFEDREDFDEDDDVIGVGREARGVQSTNLLQREVKNEGSILHRSFLDKLSESNAGLKDNSLIDPKKNQLEYFGKEDMMAAGGAQGQVQDPETLYLELVERETTLSADRLRNHINKNHPKKMDLDLEEYRDWSLCQNVGSLFANACFSKKKITAFIGNMGIGPSLFLMSLKAYLRLFLVLSVLAVPSCILLASGNQGDSLELGGGVTELLSRVSLGNIGYQASFACNQINLAKLQSNLTLSCPVGKFQRIVSVGLQNPEKADVCTQQLSQKQIAKVNGDGVTIINEQNANSLGPDSQILQYYVDFAPQCSTYLSGDLRDSQTLTYLAQKFSESCVGQSNCNIDFDYRGLDAACLQEVIRRSLSSQYTELSKNLVDTRNEDYQFLEWYLEIPSITAQIKQDGEFTYGPDEQVPEPLLYLIAQCDNQILKLNYFDIQLSKGELNQFLIVSDIVLTILLIVGILTITNMQYDLCREYDALSVTPRDFTVVIDPLPRHLKQCPDQLSLQLCLKKHLDTLASTDSEAPPISSQISMISFAVRDEPMKRLQLMRDVKQAFSEVVQQQAKQIGLRDGRILETKKENKELCQQRLTESVEKMKQCVEAYKHEQQVNEQETQLNDHDQVDTQQFKENAFGQKVERVYITFNSMKTKLMVEHQMRLISYRKIQEMTKCGSSSKTDQKKLQQHDGIKIENQLELKQGNNENQEQELFIRADSRSIEHFKTQPITADHIKRLALSTRPAQYEPDNILWNNFENRGKNYKIGLLLEVICVVATALIIQGSIKGFQSDYVHRVFSPESNIFANRTVQCTRNYTFQEAYADIVASRETQNIQTITCFCRQQYQALSFAEFMDLDFNDYVIQQGDELVHPIPKYCQDWFQYYFYQKAQAVGPTLISVGLHNLLGVPLAWLTVKMYGFVSRDTAAMKWFSLNYYMSFLNIGIILPFYSQNTQVPDLDSTGNVSSAVPTMFSRAWFLNVSSSLGFAISLNFVLYYMIILVKSLHKSCQRYKDRGYASDFAQETSNPTADQNDAEDLDEKPESKMATQSLLHDLYTGDEFDAGMVQAQVLTLLSVCIMFCGTMPLLYSACFFGLCFFYWFNKFTMLKFNSRHSSYTERLITASYHLLAFPILLHLIITFNIFRLSPMLRAIMYPLQDFENQVQISELDKHLSAYPEELKTYVVFMAITITLYFLYVLSYSTMAILMQEGYCQMVPQKKTRSASAASGRSRRRQKYLVKEDKPENAEDAQNQSNMSAMRMSMEGRPLSTISRASSNISKYSVKQNFKLQFAGAQKTEGSDEYLSRRIASNNYFGDVSFNTLYFLLGHITNQAVQFSKRINLYTHVVQVLQQEHVDNYDPEIQLFRSQILAYESYYETVLDNKSRIESEIDFYWQYVLKYFENNGEEDGDQRPSNAGLNHSQIQGQHDLRKSVQKLNKVLDGVVRGSVVAAHNEGGEAEQEHEQVNNQEIELRVDNSQEQQNERNGQVHGERAQLAELSQLNKLINSKLEQKSRVIEDQNRQIEQTLMGSLTVPLAKLNFLLQNYEEELLHYHGLAGKLRCLSRVQTYHVLDSLEFRSEGENSSFDVGAKPGSSDIERLFASLIEAAELVISDPTILEKRLPKGSEQSPERQSQPRRRLTALLEEQEAQRAENKMTIEETIPATSVTHRTDHKLLGNTQENDININDPPNGQEPTVLLAEPARELQQKQANDRYNDVLIQRNSLVGDSRESRGILRDINATGIFPTQNDSHHLDI